MENVDKLSPRPETIKDNRFLAWVEATGNKLPHPFLLFVYLAVFVMVISAVLNYFGINTYNPKTAETYPIKSLLSGDGIAYMFTNFVKNFVNFPPLGTIITVMLGIGLAERVGLLSTLLTQTVAKAPRHLLTFCVFLAGICGSIASDANYLILIPLVAMVFHSVGRNPLAGAAAAYAAAGAGFDASLFITVGDALFAGIATDAARIVDPDAYVSAVDNYYFVASSVFILATVGTLIIDKVVEPRLNKIHPLSSMQKEQPTADVNMTSEEKLGLKRVAWFTLGYLAFVMALVLPESSALRNADGGLIPSPFLKSLVPFMFFYFLGIGVIYGKTVGKIAQIEDIPALMAESVKALATTLVLFLAIAQFIAYFKWTGIGNLVAFEGAHFLQSVGFDGYALIISFILITCICNVFMTSGSAQFALFAPIFIPMLMQLNIEPAFTLAMFRIGDSATNIISPMSPYFSVALVYMQSYKPELRIGTLMATMLPLAIGFLVFWTAFLLLWTGLGLDVGPGVSMYIN
ncbi:MULTISPECIES: AbgT family transporter [Vibrio]|uniref:AbgT family transporter n=1 Tax=Vibrio TaxID=662 RepID=UPI001BD6539F|nr:MULTISPECIES: AbgT family transporter [Vibrio]MBS9811362.1 AbgT family transporter [Vibrio alginolyticus]MBS9825549.1 AbgT family transporter [Vibrio alginolyticus]MCR9641036.1 AbgT family transporter [Vibrio alginolyticus]MDV5037140.1 AbgT family transporter [Vibrio diabolicus]MDW1605376.1 AbgT family transporter [Vibrio sp. Vb2977]